MEIKEAENLKFNLQEKIEKLLNDFQDETGLAVKSIHWSTYDKGISVPEAISYVEIVARLKIMGD